MTSARKSKTLLGGGFVLLLASTLVGQAVAGTWTPLSPTGGPPTARMLHSAGYDETNNRMIVFGGFTGDPDSGSCTPSNTNCRNDVWVLQNADGQAAPSWTQLSPLGTPPTPRGYHTAVYDSASNRMIVYAGDPSIGFCFGAVNDVWVLTNANGLGGTPAWTQLSPTGGPPPLRQGPKAVYDPANNRMIVFGGVSNACGSASNAVWVLSNANGLGGAPAWTQLSPTGVAPSPLGSHTTVYDPATNKMIVFGGCAASCPSNAVWVLSNANGLGGIPAWTQLSPTGGPPSPRFGHTAVYEPGTNEMTVFGGLTSTGQTNEVWVLSNANGLGGTPAWTQLSPTGGPPSPRDLHTAVLNAATGRMTIYAGRSCVPGDCVVVGDVWVMTVSAVEPFAAFAAKVEIQPLASTFEVKAHFTLGAGSNGIAPLTEDVHLDVGTFSTTIPAGSFRSKSATPKKPAQFKFEGIINGVLLEAKITALGGGTFEFKAEGQGANLTGTVNPVTVGLTIGNDDGSTMVTAEFE